MRSVALLVVIVLAACSGDDDRQEAQSVTTDPATTVTTTATATTTCEGADPVPPAGEVVATAGQVLLVAGEAGASADVVTVHGLVDCAYEQLSLDGRPAVLAHGGTVTHGDGIRCGDGVLTVLQATSDDGVTYEARAITYSPRGGDLVEVDRTSSTIDGSSDAGELDAYYRLDC